MSTEFWALYGAILATISLIVSAILGINELTKNKPRILVKLRYTTLYSPSGQPSEPLIGAEVINRGAHAVTLSSCGWQRKDKMRDAIIQLYMVRLPFSLSPGRRLSMFFPTRWLKHERLYLYTGFYVESEDGNVWRGKLNKKMREELGKTSRQGWRILYDKGTQTYIEEYNVPESLRNQLS